MRSRVQDKTQFHPKNVYNHRFVSENSTSNNSATKESLGTTARISQHHNGYFTYLT